MGTTTTQPTAWKYDAGLPVTDTVAPAITGNATPGQMLRADAGPWSPNPDDYDYQWLADGVPIPGADAWHGHFSTYTIPPAMEVGTKVSVQVTAGAASRRSTTVTSAPVTVLGGGPGAPRPDGLIKKGTRAYVGNGVYNTAGTGQTVTAKKRPTQKTTFFIVVQNDGSAKDGFTVAGAGQKMGFRVAYFAGNLDITAAVVAGRYRSRNLDPGERDVIKLVVKVKATAKKGVLRSWPLTATSVRDTTRNDTVRANIKVPTQ